VISMDLYSTILEIAGVATGQSDLDGVSLVPTLTRTGKITRDALYWHYPHYNIPSGGSLSRGYGAIRMGSWRLVEFYEDGRVELYRLADDIGETNDLAAEMPYKANQLKTKLQNWRRAVGAQMRTPR
jgi:arylsulfatase A